MESFFSFAAPSNPTLPLHTTEAIEHNAGLEYGKGVWKCVKMYRIVLFRWAGTPENVDMTGGPGEFESLRIHDNTKVSRFRVKLFRFASKR